MIHIRSLLPLLFITLSACASSTGFDRAEMLSLMRQTVTLSIPKTATEAPAPNPTRSTPFRLGILFTQKDFPTRASIRLIEWLSRDRDRLIHALAPLQDRRILSDVLVIAPSAVQSLSLTDIRHAAARYGADLLLIVSGAGAVDRYNNAYAVLYPTVIGAYLAPGTVSEALCLIEGRLWEVRSGIAVGAITAEGQSTQIGAATALDDRDALYRAQTMAVEEFGRRLSTELLHREHPAAPAPREPR